MPSYDLVTSKSREKEVILQRRAKHFLLTSRQTSHGDGFSQIDMDLEADVFVVWALRR